MRLSIPGCLILMACLLQGCLHTVKTDASGGGTESIQNRDASEPYWKDQKIEARAIDLVYEQFNVYLHVNVTSFNSNVLLSGEVPDETTSKAIEKIVSGIEGVRHVNNELVISGNSSLVSRSNDSLITSSLKLRLVGNNHFNAGDIKVVVENGVVFLMGNVKRAAADAAADIASTTSRVKQVVKIFEYTD